MTSPCAGRDSITGPPSISICIPHTLNLKKRGSTEGGDPLRIFTRFTARRKINYTQVQYQDNDCLLFGSETYGLPAELIVRFGDRALTIPMPSRKVRSLNLSTATGIVLYEALRQLRRW